jgi:hypothetical protein
MRGVVSSTHEAMGKKGIITDLYGIAGLTKTTRE